MIRKQHVIVAVLLLCAAQPVQAFGLRTHLYIAERVLDDVRGDDPEKGCEVAFGTTTERIPSEVCRAIQQYPGEFLAGAIGPDGFPDLIVGQSFVHPGTENGRQTGDWLDLMLSRAETPAEIAFAYGNMMHAAGDIFAHSYVNNYAGGVFEITEFRSKDIELRHTLLEKYIDQRLDYEPPLEMLHVPSEFVVDTMVRTSYVPMNQSLDVADLARLFANPYREIGKILGTKVKATAPGSHMMMMWGMLAVAEEQERLAPCEEVTAVHRQTLALRDYLEAEDAARRADLIRRGQPTAAPLPLPARDEVLAEQPTCAAPAAHSLRGYPEDRREGAPTDIALAEAEAAYATLLAQGDMISDDLATNRRTIWWDGLRRADRKPLLKAFKAYEGAIEKREQARALRVFSDYWADDVRRSIMAYMEASLETAKDMVRSSAPEPAFNSEGGGGAAHYERWFDCYKPALLGEPVLAAEARCERTRALKTDTSLAEAARMAGIGKFNRTIVYDILAFQKWINDEMTDAPFGIGRVVAPSIADLVSTLTDPKRIGRDDLDKTFARAGNGQVRFTCVSDWIDADLGMLPRWEGSGARPDADCAKETQGDSETTDFAPRTSDYLVPSEFVPLQYAITFGKLALLDQDGIKRLARNLAPDVTDDIYTGDGKRYSVVIDTARSLDGSYQWSGAAMPYPRQKGYSQVPKEYQNNGYPNRTKPDPELRIVFDLEIKDRPGFPYFRTDHLRQKVFAKLFPRPFEGEILKAAQFDAEHYPFKPCLGDPFRAAHGGQGPNRVCSTTPTTEGWRADALEKASERMSRALDEVTDRVPAAQSPAIP